MGLPSKLLVTSLVQNSALILPKDPTPLTNNVSNGPQTLLDGQRYQTWLDPLKIRVTI